MQYDHSSSSPRGRCVVVTEALGSESSLSLTVDGLRTAIHCPRRYEFEHVHGLDGTDGDESSPHRRLELCRQAICDGLRTSEPERLETAALERLETLFADRDDRFHSLEQRRHEKRVLEATVRAYAGGLGGDHARGLAELQEATDGELVGPGLPLSATVALPEEDASVRIDAPVDYLVRDGSAITAVRFVPTLRSLGLLRYRSDWDGDVADHFRAHFDPDDDTFDPAVVGALLETSVVLDGVRTLRDRLGLGDGVCRYAYVSLAERSNLTVNWARETVETSLESLDLTEVFLDHQTFGMTLEHRNHTVERELAGVLRSIAAGEFDPRDQWDQISDHSCTACSYAVCCPDYVENEVRFDE